MIAAIVALSTTLSSCSASPEYIESRSVSRLGWSQDSVITFVIPAPDHDKAHELLLNIRHAENYPYQNLWLFSTDTMEIYLADDRGNWLGNHKNGLVEMPVLLDDHYVFESDTVVVSIRHGMRDSLLRGITDIMLSVYGKE